MMKLFPRAGPAACLVLFVLILSGCDEKEEEPKDQQLLEAQKRAREQAEQDRRRAEQLREQDRRILEAQRKEAESDASTAMLLWATTAIAMAVVIVLLARERRLRRVLEHLVRRLLGQKHERGP